MQALLAGESALSSPSVRSQILSRRARISRSNELISWREWSNPENNWGNKVRWNPPKCLVIGWYTDLSYARRVRPIPSELRLSSYQAFKTSWSRHIASLVPTDSSWLSNLNGPYQSEDICNNEDICCGAMCACLSGGCRPGRGCHVLWSRVRGTSNRIRREVQSWCDDRRPPNAAIRHASSSDKFW